MLRFPPFPPEVCSVWFNTHSRFPTMKMGRPKPSSMSPTRKQLSKWHLVEHLLCLIRLAKYTWKPTLYPDTFFPENFSYGQIRYLAEARFQKRKLRLCLVPNFTLCNLNCHTSRLHNVGLISERILTRESENDAAYEKPYKFNRENGKLKLESHRFWSDTPKIYVPNFSSNVLQVTAPFL